MATQGRPLTENLWRVRPSFDSRPWWPSGRAQRNRPRKAGGAATPAAADRRAPGRRSKCSGVPGAHLLSSLRSLLRAPAAADSRRRSRGGRRAGSRPRTRPALRPRGYLRPESSSLPYRPRRRPSEVSVWRGTRPAREGLSSAPRPGERGRQGGGAAASGGAARHSRAQVGGSRGPGRGCARAWGGAWPRARPGRAWEGKGRGLTGAGVARGEGGAVTLSVLAGRGGV